MSDHSPAKFDFEKSLKTKPENTFFNIQSLFYISANTLTKIFFSLNIHPHFIIFLSMVFGIISSFLIIQENEIVVIIGASLLFYKNVLDKVDGSLARAKGLDSRRGRFYDSISDFVVTAFVFTAIAIKLYSVKKNHVSIIIVYLAMIFSMLQCSYFIYYQVSFIILTGKKTVNRLIENITAQDRENEDKYTLFLQKIFLIIYGWQDMLVMFIDKWLLNKLKANSRNDLIIEEYWYNEKKFLTLASFLSIGSHVVLIAIFSVFKRLDIYLFVNLILWNLLLISSIIYHWLSVKIKIKSIGT